MTTITPSASSRRGRFVVGLIVACLWLTAAARPEAQELYGSVVGVVNDAQGGLLPGATVVVVNRDTNLRRETITDTEGAYTFTNVQAGPYDVRIALTGFREAVRAGVPVTVGQISRVDIALEIGGVERDRHRQVRRRAPADRQGGRPDGAEGAPRSRTCRSISSGTIRRWSCSCPARCRRRCRMPRPTRRSVRSTSA